MQNWLIYRGVAEPHDGIVDLPYPPPWRGFTGGPPLPTPQGGSGDEHGAKSYRPTPQAIEQVNAALYLRRPLLVTGPPGAGKSTLAYAVARELRLGPVLHWPITSRVTLRDGLYQYDPITRLYAASRAEDPSDRTEKAEDIGRYIRLGPLGTALLPFSRPRVLLIDEIDKSDIDLPNDLLTIFEKGEYEILELARLADSTAQVMTADGTERVTVEKGQVRTRAFPIVVMTSNGEREFPPAFLRRCIRLELVQPEDADGLTQIVEAHLGDLAAQSHDLVANFLNRRTVGTLATDQLLNAVYLVHHAAAVDGADRVALADKVMPYLTELGLGEDDLLDDSDDDD